MVRYYLVFAFSLLCLSMSSIIIRFSEVPINIFGFWRLLIASVIVFLIYKMKLTRLFDKNKKLNTSKKINLRDGFLLIVLGGIFFSHLWTFFYAAKNTKIANAMIIYSVNPLFTALGSYFFFK